MTTLKLSRTLIFFMIIPVLAMTACNKDDEDNPDPQPQGYTGQDGFFIINEGNFGAGNGSISFYSYPQDQLYENLYQEANGQPIGDTPLDIIAFGDTAAISVNTSGLIHFVDINTMNSIGHIQNLSSPRQMVVHGNRLFVSDLSLGLIHIIDLNTLAKSGEIITGKAVEHMVIHEDYLYAVCWSNFYVNKPNNTLLKINLDQESLVDSLVLTKEPNSLCLDPDQQLWVLCSGGYLNEETPALYRINLGSFNIESRLDFELGTDYPSALSCGGDKLYFINKGSIWQMEVNAPTLPSDPFFSAGTSFYNLQADPDGLTIVVTDARDYQGPGEIIIIDTFGNPLKRYDTGILPSGIYFN